MVDISAIAGMMTALKGAKDIATAMKELRDGTLIQEKVIELNGKILDAQSSAFVANDERTSLIDQVRQLEKRVAELEVWETEKARYVLTNVGDGVLAYRLKAGVEGNETQHLLCAHCFQKGQKSFLQATQELKMRRRLHLCPACKTQYAFSYVPPTPVQAQTTARYNPFERR